jgi:class 3 adenylate cyclase
LIAKATGSIGFVYFMQSKAAELNNENSKALLSKALEMQLKSLQISEQIGAKELLKEIFASLSETYKSLSDFKSALYYHEQFHDLEKEILGLEVIKQKERLHFQRNLEIKEKEIEFEKREKEISQNLLLNILPAEVAEELKNNGKSVAKYFNEVTVLFTDFVNFTQASERLSPQQLVDELHTCFSAFDEIIAKYNIEKIKTVGDAYLAAAGLPSLNPNHATDVIRAAIDIRNYMANRKHKAFEVSHLLWGGLGDVRLGIHSGAVVAGIVGVKKFAYDIWGDTVNTAARMEQNSEPGKINISATTYEIVKDQFKCEYRGEIEAKNKGKLKMYFITD